MGLSGMIKDIIYNKEIRSILIRKYRNHLTTLSSSSWFSIMWSDSLNTNDTSLTLLVKYVVLIGRFVALVSVPLAEGWVVLRLPRIILLPVHHLPVEQLDMSHTDVIVHFIPPLVHKAWLQLRYLRDVNVWLLICDIEPNRYILALSNYYYPTVQTLCHPQIYIPP